MPAFGLFSQNSLVSGSLRNQLIRKGMKNTTTLPSHFPKGAYKIFRMSLLWAEYLGLNIYTFKLVRRPLPPFFKVCHPPFPAFLIKLHGFLLVSCICDFFIFSPENVLDQQKTAVVCYCSVGYRSSILAQKINSQGRINPLVIINIKSFCVADPKIIPIRIPDFNNSDPDPI